MTMFSSVEAHQFIGGSMSPLLYKSLKISIYKVINGKNKQ